MRDRLRRPHGEEGVVAILVAASMVFFLGLTAFAVDVGNAYATKRKLSTAADGAALAAAQELAFSATTCDNALTRQAAVNVAEDYNVRNQAPAGADVDISCPVGSPGEVTVTNDETVDVLLAGALGQPDFDVAGSAVARYGIPGSVTELAPFSFCETSLAIQAVFAQGPPVPEDSRQTVRVPVVLPEDQSGPAEACDLPAGAVGVLNLQNDGKNVARKVIADWFRGEFDSNPVPEIKFPGAVTANEGAANGNELRDALNEILGETLVFPLHASADGPPDQRFNLSSLVAAKFCGWKLQEKTDDGSGGCPAPLPSLSEPDSYFDLLFVEHIVVGGVSDLCIIPAPCSVGRPRVLELIK